MSQALATRNIKNLLGEYERVAEWYQKEYNKDPEVFCKYNDVKDRFEVVITLPYKDKYIESISYIDGPKLYDSTYVNEVKEKIFPNLKRIIKEQMDV